MLLVSFCSWWYGKGWLQLIHSAPSRVQGVSDAFSAGQLLKTLFAPWRRIMTYPGASMQAKLKAWADNTFSRAVGFVVRLVVLLAALLTMLLVAIVTLLEIIVWPILPIAIPGGLILGAIL